MKHKIAQIIAIIFYYTGIVNLFYLLNSKAKRIVTFHNVMPVHLLPCGKFIGMIDTEDSFRFKIKEIKRFFRITTDITDCKSVTITFDDGYKNQFEVAGRILKEEFDAPAIFFVSGRNIDNNEPSNALVVDLLLHWTFLAPNGIYRMAFDEASNIDIDFELNSFNRQQIWQKNVWPNFVKDGVTKGRYFLAQLNKMYPISDVLKNCSSEYLRLRLTGISVEDIKTVNKNNWLVGWHTQEHFPLSKLTPFQKKQEIASAPEFMKKVAFSYPYGEEVSVDMSCIKIAEACGYPCAVSNLTTSDMVGRFFIPRFTLQDNRYMLHFELSGLKCFLKTGKLLPKINLNPS